MATGDAAAARARCQARGDLDPDPARRAAANAPRLTPADVQFLRDMGFPLAAYARDLRRARAKAS